MPNQNENETTDQLPPPSHEARITALEAGFVAQQSTLNEINTKLDAVIRMQQETLEIQREMYADLRGWLSAIERDIFQIKQDIQPDSFQNRLMRTGQ